MSEEMIPADMIKQASRRFKLLSEPVRLELLNQMNQQGEMAVQELVEATGHQQANVSKHLGLMAREGMVQRRKEGLHAYYSIADPTLAALCMLVSSRLQQEVLEEDAASSGAAR